MLRFSKRMMIALYREREKEGGDPGGHGVPCLREREIERDFMSVIVKLTVKGMPASLRNAPIAWPAEQCASQ